METIGLSEILGMKIKKIQSGSELLFIYELSKYTKEILGKTLVLEDIQVIKELRKTVYFSYLYKKGIDLNYVPLDVELVDTSECNRLFFNSDLRGIVYEKQTDEEWVFNYQTDTKANLILNQYNRSAGYVSLYAYMVVLFYKNNKKVPLLILKNTSSRQEELSYVDILILSNFGNKMLENKVKVEYSREVVTQPEWEAYIMYNRQLGFLQEEISPLEKLKYVYKNYQIGDVVLYYKTEKSIKSKTIRRLLSCHPAVIREITKNNIKIEYYPVISTSLTHKRELERAEELCESSYQYTHDDYNRFNSCFVTLDYYNTGIDLLFYTEDEFILQAQNGVDRFKQYLIDKNGIEGLYELDTLNTIYAVFEDRNISYDKERFLNKYFKKSKPVYDSILGN